MSTEFHALVAHEAIKDIRRIMHIWAPLYASQWDTAGFEDHNVTLKGNGFVIGLFPNQNKRLYSAPRWLVTGVPAHQDTVLQYSSDCASALLKGSDWYVVADGGLSNLIALSCLQRSLALTVAGSDLLTNFMLAIWLARKTGLVADGRCNDNIVDFQDRPECKELIGKEGSINCDARNDRLCRQLGWSAQGKWTRRLYKKPK